MLLLFFKSKPREIYSGVLQGPMLFNVYVHDITVAILSNAKLYQYADDIQIVLTYVKNETKQKILCDVENTISSIDAWIA